MLANICPSCRTGGVHNLPVLTIFYPVAGKRTGIISHADPTLANVKVNLHTEYQDRRPNGEGVRAFTDGRTLLSKCIIVLV